MPKTYKINEIFKSVQGEGAHTGTPVIFVRFSGCNLSCEWCDTKHHTDARMVFTASQVARAIAELSTWQGTPVVFTGGEPLLQLDSELIDIIPHPLWVETNGSVPFADNVQDRLSWVSCSPKEGIPLTIPVCSVDEFKLVFPRNDMDFWNRLPIEDWQQMSIQPCQVAGDDDATRRNIATAVQYVTDNPTFRLSLQTHKLIGVR